MLNLDSKLATLLVVAEVKNYTAAAKILNLTQPAVSQHIAALEKELNIRIFNRLGNQITLTPEGEILVRYARRISSLYKELETKIDDERRQARSLRIGITHSSEGNLVPEVLANIVEARPGTSIKIITDSIKNLYDKLSTFEIDLAVVEGKVTGDRFSKILLETDSLVAIMAKDHPLAKKAVIGIEDLEKEPLILRSSTSATRNLFVAQLEADNRSLDEFNVTLEIDNTATIKSLVKKGNGISVLPKSVCHNESEDHSLAIRPIENMNMVTEINLVFLKTMQDRTILDEIVHQYRMVVTKGNE